MKLLPGKTLVKHFQSYPQDMHAEMIEMNPVSICHCVTKQMGRDA
jgi:hypothetical protein